VGSGGGRLGSVSGGVVASSEGEVVVALLLLLLLLVRLVAGVGVVEGKPGGSVVASGARGWVPGSWFMGSWLGDEGVVWGWGVA
jgi:hypothetical protein